MKFLIKFYEDHPCATSLLGFIAQMYILAIIVTIMVFSWEIVMQYHPSLVKTCMQRLAFRYFGDTCIYALSPNLTLLHINYTYMYQQQCNTSRVYIYTH